MKHCQRVCAVILVAALGVLFGNGVSAQENLQGETYRVQMHTLLEELQSSTSADSRRAVLDRIRGLRQEYRATHPVKEPAPAEREANKQKLEEMLKRDPFQWQIYKLRQSIVNAKSPEERERGRTQFDALRDKHAAEEEAELTPEQRVQRQARQEKSMRMQAELKPLMDRRRQAQTREERIVIHEEMREVFEKYK